MRVKFGPKFSVFFAALILSIYPVTARADPFVAIAIDNEVTVVVDLDGISKTIVKTVKAWEITYYATPQFKLKGRAVKQVKRQHEIRCSERETRSAYVFAYDEQGEVIDHGPTRDGWMPSPPGSHLVDLVRVACNGSRADDVILDDMDHLIRTYEDMLRLGLD